MNNKNNLLKIKRRLIALSFASGCLIGLAGCSDDGNNVSELSNEAIIVNEDVTRKEQFLCIYEDKAIIIEPKDCIYYHQGSYYGLALDDSFDMLVPMSQFIYFKKENPITAEDYVALVCGPDFPIEYIRSEDYTRSR